MSKYTFHSGPPTTEAKRVRGFWSSVRADLLHRAATKPGTWMMVERAVLDKTPYAPHKVRTKSALNGIRVNVIHRKALPQKNESRKIRRWEIWMQVDPEWYAAESVRLNSYPPEAAPRLSAAAGKRLSRERRLDALRADPLHPRHGSNAAYTDGCRCESCAEAHRAYERELYARKKELAASWSNM